MDELQLAQELNRRHFLARSGLGLGASRWDRSWAREPIAAAGSPAGAGAAGACRGLPHFAPKAKRVIYLFQSGAPSQIDLFDRQAGDPGPAGDRAARLGPHGAADHDDDLGPEEPARGAVDLQVRPATAESAPSSASFLPHTAKVADDLCIIRSVQTEAINHDPAITFVQTGSQLAGRPSMGAWVATAWGARTRTCRRSSSCCRAGRTDQPLYDRLWGSGFLPTRYQGVKFRGGKEPVLYLANPAGCSPRRRRQMLDDLGELNQLRHAETGDPEILTRIAQYELAYRMQTSVPELTDLSSEPKLVLDLYGPDVHEARELRRELPAGPAAGRARRAVHPALSHGLGPAQQPARARSASSAATPTSPPPRLITDLKQRGLLDDTLVIWGGEFGRTVYSQGTAHRDRLRPRPPPALLHHLDGRRRHQAGPDPRRDRRLLLQHHEGPGPGPRPQRDDPALLGIDHTRLTYRSRAATSA